MSPLFLWLFLPGPDQPLIRSGGHGDTGTKGIYLECSEIYLVSVHKRGEKAVQRIFTEKENAEPGHCQLYEVSYFQSLSALSHRSLSVGLGLVEGGSLERFGFSCSQNPVSLEISRKSSFKTSSFSPLHTQGLLLLPPTPSSPLSFVP